MAKKKQTSQPNVISASFPPGIMVDKIEEVTRRCRDVLATVLGDNSIGFHRQEIVRSKYRCMLVGQAATSARARDQYMAHSLLETDLTSYWLAITIWFQFYPNINKYHVESVSLIVFEGVATSIDKTPLLRAEWDCFSHNDNVAHAQPHWHVYISAIENLSDQMASFTQPSEVKTFIPPDTETTNTDVPEQWDGARFHFAMAAKWHIDENCIIQEILGDIDGLTKWLTGCIKYINNQLEYISTRQQSAA